MNKTYLAAAGGAVLATGALTITSVLAAPQAVIDALNLSDEQVAILDEAHELRQSGDREGAHELMQSLDIDPKEFRSAMHKAMHAHKDAIHEAIEAGDYATFQELTQDGPMSELTEDQFNTLREAHALKEAGDFEAAHELMEEAGIEMKHRTGHGMHGGMMMGGFGKHHNHDHDDESENE